MVVSSVNALESDGGTDAFCGDLVSIVCQHCSHADEMTKRNAKERLILMKGMTVGTSHTRGLNAWVAAWSIGQQTTWQQRGLHTVISDAPSLSLVFPTMIGAGTVQVAHPQRFVRCSNRAYFTNLSLEPLSQES